MTGADELLYEKDLRARPRLALGLGAGLAVGVAVAAIFTTPLLLLATLPVLAAALAGYLRATTRLEVFAGRVTVHSRRGVHDYDAATLTLERRDSSKVFVLAKTGARSGVVCVFDDDFTDFTREAFESAGVTVTVTSTSVDALAHGDERR